MRKVIGKGGNVIDRIENTLGLHIDVREMEAEAPRSEKGRRYPAESRATRKKTELFGFEEEAIPSSVRPLIEINKKHLILEAPELAGKDVEIFIEDEYLFSATVSRHGEISSDLILTLHPLLSRLRIWKLIKIRPI